MKGKNPKSLTIPELKWWLQCHSVPLKGLKTKAQFVHTVQKVLESPDTCRYKIIDPSTDKSYLSAKKRNLSIQKKKENELDDIELPSTGWTCDFYDFPDFTDIAIRDFTNHTGKKKQGKTCVKPERRGYSFFVEQYVHDYMVCPRQDYYIIKAKCFHSQSKNAEPHELWMALSLSFPHYVKKAHCKCKAGSNGYCNHVLALMYLTRHISSLGLKSAPETLSKTSQPQQWNKPNRMKGIHARPIMAVVVFKTCNDGASKGVRCTLYDACKKHTNEIDQVEATKEALKKINPNFGFNSMVTGEDANTEYVPTRINDILAPRGSPLSYQAGVLEPHVDTLSIDQTQFSKYPCHGCPDNINTQTFPSLPLKTEPIVSCVKDLPALNKVKVTEAEAIEIEFATVGQHKCQRWFDEKKFRLTASKFANIVKRKTTNHTKFVRGLICNSQSASASTEVRKGPLKHGIDNEDNAAERYSEYMQSINHPVHIFQSGLVINPAQPQYGCSPDRKIFDPSFHPHHGIAEIKCPYTLRCLTPSQAALYGDNKFPLTYINGKLVLKEDHEHMIQIMAQMAISNTKWCDYILYTLPGLHIQRVFFDQRKWDEDILPKLDAFYFDHYAPKLAETLQ